jgi:hypothetical protein
MQSAADTTGTCESYFSVSDGTNIYAKTEEDTFLCAASRAFPTSVTSGSYEYKMGDQFVPGEYDCGKSIKADRAGQECIEDKDCGTSEKEITTMCKCSYAST